MSNLWVKIFLQIKEIDNSGNFRCTADDSIFPTGFTHRAPELTVKFGLTNVEVGHQKIECMTGTVLLLQHIDMEFVVSDWGREVPDRHGTRRG